MEDKAKYIVQFGELLKQTTEMKNLRALCYRNCGDIGEYVYAVYRDGSQKRIDITADSCWGLTADIRNNLSAKAYLVPRDKLSEGDILASEYLKYGPIGNNGIEPEMAIAANNKFFAGLSAEYTAEELHECIADLHGTGPEDLDRFGGAAEYNERIEECRAILSHIASSARSTIESFMDRPFATAPDLEIHDPEFYKTLSARFSVADFAAYLEGESNASYRFRGELSEAAMEYICNREQSQEQESGWQNRGDVNFFDYGGVMIRKDAGIKDSYNFFQLSIADDGTKYAFSGTICDLHDYAGEPLLKALARDRGYDTAEDLINNEPEICVMELLSEYGYGPLEFSARNCYGTGEYSLDWADFKLTDEELCKFMEEMDIPSEYIPDLTYTAVAKYGDRGIESSMKANRWEEVTAYAHDRLMSGHSVEITDTSNGSRVELDPTEYAMNFNGEFPVNPHYPLEVDYGNRESDDPEI